MCFVPRADAWVDLMQGTKKRNTRYGSYFYQTNFAATVSIVRCIFSFYSNKYYARNTLKHNEVTCSANHQMGQPSWMLKEHCKLVVSSADPHDLIRWRWPPLLCARHKNFFTFFPVMLLSAGELLSQMMNQPFNTLLIMKSLSQSYFFLLNIKILTEHIISQIHYPCSHVKRNAETRYVVMGISGMWCQ